MRPHTHKVFYGTGRWVFANRKEYDGEDRLITKWVGGMPMEEDRFLQEVNYAYDAIGRLIRINNPSTFLCNIGKEVCDFSLKLDFPLLWGENCDRLSGVKINGQVYPLATSWDLLAHQSQIAPAIEEALHTYGLDGEVSTSFVEFNGGQTLIINVIGTFATELSLILGTCGEEVALTPDCCIIPPVTPDPPISQPGEPRACTADLYHQLMRYNGLDIRHITIGSACVRMSNNYRYDGLHRITAMDNVLFGPDPHPDAFSTTYSYDAAGNIRQLMRRGLIGMAQTLQSDTIDLLDYTYAGSDSLSSILVNVKDRASNPLAQPLGVTASESGYAHDGNGNLTLAGPVLQAQYNIMNLPTSIRTSAGKRHFAYVYGGGKYSARIETTPSPNPIEETRHYLGGIEFVDGEPESYNFGDGRIVYSDTVPPRPQFRLHDHLGNTVVFFEDKNLDGCITTEADTSGLAVEVLQRLWYYPFGLQMENLSTWETAPGQAYRYNGKERDTLSGWTDFGARWGILEIGRWNGVDPLASKYYGWSPFCFTLNNPISFTDPDGRSVDDNIVFNEKGVFQRIEVTDDEFDQIVIEDSRTAARNFIQLNDPVHDSKLLRAAIDFHGTEIPLIHHIDEETIGKFMAESDVDERSSPLSRMWFASSESKGGKLDFSVYHLPRFVGEKVGPGRWRPSDFMNIETGEIDEKRSPIFIMGSNQYRGYNWFDAGNWLWGNAMNRIGASIKDARNWATGYNSKDTSADLRAIQEGWNEFER